ncbi:MAG: PRC-barrel domain-containing protein [Salinivirgaceae bacterium]|nr:PRC-barrel domain-containing protein [Salinivirgaceae bacterium]
MKTCSKFYYGLAVVAITIMMASAPIFAADMDNKEDYSMKGGYSILGSKFIGLDIENPQGDNIGKVKDIMLDSIGRINYVAVSYGGFMGMGDKMYTVPTDAFTFKRNSDSFYDDIKLVLNINKEELEADKGFDTDNWPNLDDEGYRKDLDKRYYIDRSNMNDTHKMYKKYNSTMKGGYSVLGSKFLGLEIKNPQGDNIGQVKDIILDSTGLVRYVAVSYGGFMGMGEKMYTVPMDAFTFTRDSDSFFDDVKLSLNISKEQLKDHKGFDTKNWPDLDDKAYRKELDKRYNINRDGSNMIN